MAIALMPHPPARRSSTPPVVATTKDGNLPLDLLYEILLRLPTEAICHFRAVCKSWRSLLCHPEFIAAAHNPGPLLAIGLKDSSSNEVHVLDMESCDAVKNVNIATNNAFLSPCGGEARPMSGASVVCLTGPNNRLRLLDLASGALSILPNHAPPLGYSTSSGIVGWAASTGEVKVLAITTSYRHREPQVCKILTLSLGNSCWRDTGSPPLNVMLDHKRVVVINCVAYFLSSFNQSKGTYTRRIMVFDFNNEAWRPAACSLQGPANCRDMILAELESHLVACQADGHTSIELWFLVDLDRSLWTKRYTIPMPSYKNLQPPLYREYFEKPLAVLEDGRIVMWMRVFGLGYRSQNAVLRIYNPRTKTFKDGTCVFKCSYFSVFTWSLLHLGQGSMFDIAAKRLLLGRRNQQSGATLSSEGSNKRHRIGELIWFDLCIHQEETC